MNTFDWQLDSEKKKHWLSYIDLNTWNESDRNYTFAFNNK